MRVVDVQDVVNERTGVFKKTSEIDLISDKHRQSVFNFIISKIFLTTNGIIVRTGEPFSYRPLRRRRMDVEKKKNIILVAH